MAEFNARKARTKYAVPIWADALLRDTLDLAADEIGAYHLILYAMWSRESCDFPDDDRKLARVCRVSSRLWRSRIRAALEPFFEVTGGVWVSRRLRREAVKTEEFLQSQSDRRRGDDKKSRTYALPEGAQQPSDENAQKPDNTLKTHKPPSTADTTADPSGDRPTQETKSPRVSSSSSARASDFDDPFADKPPGEGLLSEIMAAVGIKGPPIPTYWMPPAADIHVARWRDDLGLTEAQIIAAARASRSQHDEPPNGPKALDGVMRRMAGELSAGPLKPTTPRPRPGQPRTETREEKIARWGSYAANE